MGAGGLKRGRLRTRRTRLRTGVRRGSDGGRTPGQTGLSGWGSIVRFVLDALFACFSFFFTGRRGILTQRREGALRRKGDSGALTELGRNLAIPDFSLEISGKRGKSGKTRSRGLVTSSPAVRMSKSVSTQFMRAATAHFLNRLGRLAAIFAVGKSESFFEDAGFRAALEKIRKCA